MKEMLPFNTESILLNRQSTADFLKNGRFLWAFHHHSIPHLGMSANGRYFSVTFNKKQIDESVEISWRLAQNKAIPCFFIELHDLFEWQADFQDFFKSHTFPKNTCLLPILQSLRLYDKNIEIFPDLINYLTIQNKIKSWHCNTWYQKERLSLLRYNKIDVEKMVNEGRIK